MPRSRNTLHSLHALCGHEHSQRERSWEACVWVHRARRREKEAGQLTVFTRWRSWRRRRSGGGGLWRRLAQLRRAPRPARSRLGLPFVSPRLIYVPWRGIIRGWPLPDIRGALQGPWEEWDLLKIARCLYRKGFFMECRSGETAREAILLLNPEHRASQTVSSVYVDFDRKSSFDSALAISCSQLRAPGTT